jgi:hypothetical protein
LVSGIVAARGTDKYGCLRPNTPHSPIGDSPILTMAFPLILKTGSRPIYWISTSIIIILYLRFVFSVAFELLNGTNYFIAKFDCR